MSPAAKAPKKRAKRAAQPAALSTTMLIRLSPELLERMDAFVADRQSERPGWSRSDFVREAIVRALNERSKS